MFVKILNGFIYRQRRAGRRIAIMLRRAWSIPSFPIEAFDREIAAMNAGIQAFKRSKDGKSEQALLRRNVHRLEKGLTMRPRREVFAVEYLRETVDALSSAVEHRGQCRSEIAWGSDVLRQYFKVTKETDETCEARANFTKLSERLPPEGDSVPYLRGPLDYRAPSFEQLQILAHHRRSIRWFLQKPVSRKLIEKAMQVALEAPSACNRQPFVFYTFDQPERVRELAEIPMGAAGFAHQIPILIVVVGQQRNFFDPRDRHLIYVDGALAGMSFILALETLGLSSCILNWPDIADRELAMQRALGLEADERPLFLIAVGYPDPQALVARSAKRPVSELLRFE